VRNWGKREEKKKKKKKKKGKERRGCLDEDPVVGLGGELLEEEGEGEGRDPHLLLHRVSERLSGT